MPLGVVAALFLASLALRPQLLAVGPLLPFIRADLDLPAGVAGLLTSIPVLCMGIFAPLGPRLAARLGPREAFAVSLALIAGFGLLRAVVPSFPLVLAATLGIGFGVGVAGAIPSMVVSTRMPSRPALGTGAYAGGIVAGSTLAAALAVPLALDGAWRVALAVISVASFLAIVVWLVLVRPDPPGRRLAPRAVRLPWGSRTAWVLLLVFGVQSLLYYGVVSWLANVFVERGWTPAAAGSLVAVVNAVGLVTTLGVPLLADRLGARRPQLVASSVAATLALLGLLLAPDLAVAWVVVIGLALGAIFPLVLTLPLDVTDDPAQVGSVAALMLLGGYILSSTGPVLLGAARDATGSFEVSLWILVLVAVILDGLCVLLSPARLRRGIGRTIQA